MSRDEVQWCLVVPVKRLEAAKTRLGPPYDVHRRELALAFAADTTVAALTSDIVRAVVVVTDEPVAAEVLSRAGAVVVADEPGDGLNPALVHGAVVAANECAGCGVGAVSADLPALRPDELTTVLRRAAGHERSFLADAGGTGTTVVLARTLEGFQPEFGEGSADRHRASGLVGLPGDDVPSVRLDVDTPHDLRRAQQLGVGARTAELLARLG